MKYKLNTIILLLTINMSIAQITIPSASPKTTIDQKIGVTDIKLIYSRPSINDRDIFSENGLVPFEKHWRTGANSPTTLTTSDDITIGGKSLPAGDYVLLTKPNDKAWQVMIYEKVKGGWNTYIEKQPVVIYSAEVFKSTLKMESLLIYIDNIKSKSADIIIQWDKTLVRIPFEVQVHEKVMANIKKVMKGPSDFEYFQAASYLYSADYNLEQALDYIRVATKGDNPTFFYLRREATILAKLNRYKEAIASAEKSNELGKVVGNIDVIKINNESIEEWKKKL